MFQKLVQRKKIIIILLLSTVMGSTIVYGGIRANDYRNNHRALQEAKQLSSEGKYQEAIGKLIVVENKWSPESLKKEIKLVIEENKLLAESSENYELGKEVFENDDYSEVLEILQRVDSRDINYLKARSLIELAEIKISKSKGEVAGAKTENKRTTQVVSEILPTSTPTPTTVIPSPEPQVDVTALCSAKKQKLAGSMAQVAFKARAEDEADAKSDLIKYQLWLQMDPNLQIMLKNWMVKTLGEYEVYCLSHDGNDSGWSPSSGPYDNIKW